MSPKSISDARHFAAAALVGVLVGLIGGLFHVAIDSVSRWPAWLASHTNGWLHLTLSGLITALITVLCVLVVRRVAPEAAGSGVQEIEGAMDGVRIIRWQRILPVKFFTGILSIGSGLVLGREGPTIHIGASISAWLSNKTRQAEHEHKGLLAAGAAAGLACAFNAPVAALLFVGEEMRRQFPFSFRNFMAVAIACVLATAFASLVTGASPGPDLHLAIQASPLALTVLPAFVVLGGLLGLLGLALNKGLLFASSLSAFCHKHLPYAFPATVGLSVGLLLVAFPSAVTGGEKLIQQLSTTPPALGVLLTLVVVRFLTTTASYATGVPGGIFAPILSLAFCAGLGFGTLANSLPALHGLDPVVFGIAAMGGLFAASVHAPTVGIILIAELTGAYSLLLPLMITCMSAYITAKWLGGKPIYEELLERVLKQTSTRS
ncbi:chloride channel protein [Pusillimonas sp. T2]|uniref:H(+)/Cl(-) exchange transporter ClcA n=1 Tax=Pusillimonas sp. T2 TaxID=1548123 RepID=UPI000B8A65F9|nr:H(+)/Cl(-) exchange transporter ClcA [Pusillimonas sp. T2]OXR47875.1 chloride channel protein [Pusillimonas sp. T2]